jgi:hypothetical protein
VGSQGLFTFFTKKDHLMNRRFGTWALPGLALGALLPAGCSSSTTNEENAGATKVIQGGETPNIKSYGDYARYQTDKDAKERAAAKGKKATPGQPKSETAQPKSETAQPKSETAQPKSE